MTTNKHTSAKCINRFTDPGKGNGAIKPKLQWQKGLDKFIN